MQITWRIKNRRFFPEESERPVKEIFLACDTEEASGEKNASVISPFMISLVRGYQQIVDNAHSQVVSHNYHLVFLTYKLNQ